MTASVLENFYQRLNFYADGSKPNKEQFIGAHLDTLPVSIRFNPHKISNPPVEHPVPWCTFASYLRQRPIFTLDPVLHAGGYYVQEAGSMLCGYLFDKLFPDKQYLKVLDLCAAPGGKSTHIASLLHPTNSVLISNEVIQSRASVLAENVSKWGHINHWVTQLDPQFLAQCEELWDCIIVDAPCTGSGLWRKDADALSEWSEQHVKLCAERQKRIIADIAPALAPGGVMIYSTCSFSREENEDQIDWIVESLGWEVVHLDIPSEWNITSSLTRKGFKTFRCEPWKVAGEGFFIAVLRKPGVPYQKTFEFKNNKNTKLSNKTAQALQPWLKTPAHFIDKNEEYFAIPQDLAGFYQYLISQRIKLKKTGTGMGKLIQDQLIPHEELALSVHLQPLYPILELTREQALEFLRKNELKNEQSLTGWYLNTYQGLGLGWAKWMKNRMNNYYPKNWRIRMS